MVAEMDKNSQIKIEEEIVILPEVKVEPPDYYSEFNGKFIKIKYNLFVKCYLIQAKRFYFS